MSGTYSDLEVWQAATELAVQVYRLTALFPREERYGLTSHSFGEPLCRFLAILPKAKDEHPIKNSSSFCATPEDRCSK
jgi:hypothetical protein